ncbi:MAG: cytoplasmic protein [Chloroflexi bacterium]|nr:cytoplasmic protein [Chloroflexota bacterium]
MNRIAFLLFAGPEMPCKLQHALIFARDVDARGGEAQIIFEGHSPRWLPELAKPDHAMAKLFQAVMAEQLVAGVCKGCAAVHGATAAAVMLGLPLLADASGHVSLVPFAQRGFDIVTL